MSEQIITYPEYYTDEDGVTRVKLDSNNNPVMQKSPDTILIEDIVDDTNVVAKAQQLIADNPALAQAIIDATTSAISGGTT